MKSKSLLFIVLFILLFPICPGEANEPYLTAQDILSRPVPVPGKKIPYGPHPLQYGELRIPETKGPHPLTILLHGGCWLSVGNLNLMNPVADALKQSGIATWNLEYRPVDTPEGAWPGIFMDIMTGIDHMRKLDNKYDLDLNNLVLVGHSAGGHLALWAGARHKLRKTNPLYRPNPLKVRGVLCLGGVTDLKPAVRLVKDVCGVDATTLLLGGTQEDFPDRYAFASPIEMLPSGVREMVVFGSDDDVIRPSYGYDYVTAGKSKGQNIGLIVIPGASHYELIAPWTNGWPIIESALLSLHN